MKIYFAGAIRAGRDDAAIYATMIAWLKRFGDVLTEHVGESMLLAKGDDGPDDRYIHDRDMAWLAQCDLVVAEVTTPSLGVGYELGWATALKKPVLCLYRFQPGRILSAMIAGSPMMRTVSYSSVNEAKTIITDFMDRVAKEKTLLSGVNE
ncbi:MAG TPA: nucleoside 2-deoxyribosyltransferase [Smithella sp.]|nr:nucleoside 2-deoxyribosyltransferase [Smithella sp.]HOG91533.1 nucleoside 2-deoxyribosyltransferase [Smithella sp.]HOU51867.1 nucleoside 2-deoxyribosyltransferase [Smithella sp.]HQI74024.1 nucleoside 2-deoxyribosyltransferase [Smithella sp.]